MENPEISAVSKTNESATGLVLRLFVAGNEPHSKTAREILKNLCESRIKEPCKIEIFDVLESFETALENNIFLTPALMKVFPEPPVTIFGDLSDTEGVIKALQLGGDLS